MIPKNMHVAKDHEDMNAARRFELIPLKTQQVLFHEPFIPSHLSRKRTSIWTTNNKDVTPQKHWLLFIHKGAVETYSTQVKAPRRHFSHLCSWLFPAHRQISQFSSPRRLTCE